MTTKKNISGFGVCAIVMAGSCAALGVPDYRDTLDKAVSPQEDVSLTNLFDPYVGDTLTYDSNVFRLPPSVTDLSTLTGIGSNPRRSDYTESVTAGLDAQWLLGQRQSFDVGIRADDNMYLHNSDLNNISTNDSAIWNWGLGGVFSGQVGANYTRNLASFVNTAVYSRNILDIEQYFAGARYELGPHWSVFAGLLDAVYGLSAALTKSSDTRSRAVDMGFEYATSALDSIGLDYRYTDSRAPNAITLSTTTFNPDYREDRARILLRYVVSDKTSIDANFGYLRRDYPTVELGTFSGYIGRATVVWQTTEKTQLVFSGYRQLTADLTNQTDYFVETGGSIAPVWTPSEKITMSLSLSYDRRSYLGSNPGVETIASNRRDSIPAEALIVTYFPIKALSIEGTFSHEHRGTNQPEFLYDDDRATVAANFKF